MSAEQYDRHEAYRRSGFHRGNLRRLINAHLAGGGTGASINPTMTMAFGGVAKVFVGEIIEGGEYKGRQEGEAHADSTNFIHLLSSSSLSKRLGRYASASISHPRVVPNLLPETRRIRITS